jgi:hypothetical protein
MPHVQNVQNVAVPTNNNHQLQLQQQWQPQFQQMQQPLFATPNMQPVNSVVTPGSLGMTMTPQPLAIMAAPPVVSNTQFLISNDGTGGTTGATQKEEESKGRNVSFQLLNKKDEFNEIE